MQAKTPESLPKPKETKGKVPPDGNGKEKEKDKEKEKAKPNVSGNGSWTGDGTGNGSAIFGFRICRTAQKGKSFFAAFLRAYVDEFRGVAGGETTKRRLPAGAPCSPSHGLARPVPRP